MSRAEDSVQHTATLMMSQSQHDADHSAQEPFGSTNSASSEMATHIERLTQGAVDPAGYPAHCVTVLPQGMPSGQGATSTHKQSTLGQREPESAMAKMRRRFYGRSPPTPTARQPIKDLGPPPQRSTTASVRLSLAFHRKKSSTTDSFAPLSRSSSSASAAWSQLSGLGRLMKRSMTRTSSRSNDKKLSAPFPSTEETSEDGAAILK